MNFKISIYLLFMLTSFGSFAQYKYDIGVKVSAYKLERFQIEQRFHLNNPYSIVVTFATGFESFGSSRLTPFYNNNFLDLTTSFSTSTNNVLKIGLQRKLGFLATDVFYAGVTLGVGYEKERRNNTKSTYFVNDSMPSELPHFYEWQEVNSVSTKNTKSSIHTQANLTFGMDIPVSERFSINTEIGIGAIYYTSINYSYYELHPTFSGGLRYSFGGRT